MKQISLFVIVVLSVLLAFVVAWQLISIVLLFIISLVIAATLRAPIDYLIQSKVPRTLSIAIVYICLLLTLGSVALLVGTALVGEVSRLLEDFTNIYTRLQAGWQRGGRFGALLTERLPTTDQVAQFMASAYLDELTAGTVVLTQRALYLGSQLLLAIVLSVYWTADRMRFERLWLSLLPSTQRMHARNIWRTLEDGVGAYTRSEFVQSFLVGGILSLIYVLLGLKYPFLCALIVALAWFIPLVGGILALIPLALLVWLNSGVLVAVIASAIAVGILSLMEFLVERQLYQYGRYQKVLVLLVMLAVADLYGLVGLLIAPFIATALHIFISELAAGSASNSHLPEDVHQNMHTLKTRLQNALERLGAEESTESMRLRSMGERLNSILAQAEEIQRKNNSSYDFHENYEQQAGARVVGSVK